MEGNRKQCLGLLFLLINVCKKNDIIYEKGDSENQYDEVESELDPESEVVSEDVDAENQISEQDKEIDEAPVEDVTDEIKQDVLEKSESPRDQSFEDSSEKNISEEQSGDQDSENTADKTEEIEETQGDGFVIYIH